MQIKLALYVGCVLLTQGFDAGRKTQTLSRALADPAARTPPASIA